MAGIELKSTGALLDGRYRTVVPATLRRWVQGVLEETKRYARLISPVLTGRYRRSHRYRTTARGWDVRAEMFSDDIPGKVRVIEDGFPPRPLKRQPKRGPVRMGKGRKAERVYARSYTRMRGIYATQARLLESQLAKDLTR
jgi:hypothetical protein